MIRLVDPVTRKARDEATVPAPASVQFRRPAYQGDYTPLRLSREEKALFDPEAWRRAEEDLQKRLVDILAEKTASVVFDRVLRYVR